MMPVLVVYFVETPIEWTIYQLIMTVPGYTCFLGVFIGIDSLIGVYFVLGNTKGLQYGTGWDT
jgi:hypothetical protein